MGCGCSAQEPPPMSDEARKRYMETLRMLRPEEFPDDQDNDSDNESIASILQGAEKLRNKNNTKKNPKKKKKADGAGPKDESKLSSSMSSASIDSKPANAEKADDNDDDEISGDIAELLASLKHSNSFNGMKKTDSWREVQHARRHSSATDEDPVAEHHPDEPSVEEHKVRRSRRTSVSFVEVT